MKSHPALSVVSPAGDLIRSGEKILEIRQWSPDSIPLRDLVIVQNKIRLSSDGVTDDPDGEAIAIVDIESVKEWHESEMDEACASYWEPGWKAWRMSNVRPLFLEGRLPARLRIYSVDLPDDKHGVPNKTDEGNGSNGICRVRGLR
jgi:hypothetical protein